jgi:hypothetical protein
MDPGGRHLNVLAGTSESLILIKLDRRHFHTPYSVLDRDT